MSRYRENQQLAVRHEDTQVSIASARSNQSTRNALIPNNMYPLSAQQLLWDVQSDMSLRSAKKHFFYDKAHVMRGSRNLCKGIQARLPEIALTRFFF